MKTMFEELPQLVQDVLTEASDTQDARDNLFKLGYTCTIVDGKVDLSTIVQRVKDLRKVVNPGLKSNGKVVEVVRTDGWKCVCLFEGSEREYIINKGSLQRISQNS
jgi:hypothetical protein